MSSVQAEQGHFLKIRCLGRIMGLGIGTVLAAFTMGKSIGFAGELIDRKFVFENFMTLKKDKT